MSCTVKCESIEESIDSTEQSQTQSIIGNQFSFIQGGQSEKLLTYQGDWWKNFKRECEVCHIHGPRGFIKDMSCRFIEIKQGIQEKKQALAVTWRH